MTLTGRWLSRLHPDEISFFSSFRAFCGRAGALPVLSCFGPVRSGLWLCGLFRVWTISPFVGQGTSVLVVAGDPYNPHGAHRHSREISAGFRLHLACSAAGFGRHRHIRAAHCRLENNARQHCGGLLSMAQPAVLVALSCSYAGSFEKTDLLDGVKSGIHRLARLLTTFGCTIAISLASVAIACNQTLSSIMVHELCRDLYDNEQEMALALEDTTILLAALLPWSVASAVPLAASAPHHGASPLPSTSTCSPFGAGCTRR